MDNIGTKTLPDYARYATRHVYTVRVLGCDKPARLFAGQRREAARPRSRGSAVARQPARCRGVG